MLTDLKLNVFYPHSPERVWQVITNRRALAAWLMDNDFEPRVGHKFRFQPDSQQGFDGTIHCEVIELDEPRSLSYTWRGGLMCKPTIVTWTLLPVDGGTQLQLEHKGFESEVTQLSQPMRLAQTWSDNPMPKAILETRRLDPVTRGMPFQRGYASVDNFDRITLNFYLSGGWHSALNSRLQNVITEIPKQGRLASVASNLETANCQ
ncbi:MAG TPA: SRPBCC domain-containing protein [Coleofasciculaceae cyanobacterium]